MAYVVSGTGRSCNGLLAFGGSSRRKTLVEVAVISDLVKRKKHRKTSNLHLVFDISDLEKQTYISLAYRTLRSEMFVFRSYNHNNLMWIW